MSYQDDIPLSVAVSAYAGMSFSPEKRGQQSREEYSATLAADLAHFLAQAEKGGTIGLVAEEFERYRAGLRSRFLKMLYSRGRTLSPMITGPSNFPVRRNEKRLDVERRRVEDYLQFRERARAAIIRTLRPDLAPIMSGDDNAQERLAEKIATAEKVQERMKAANACIRKHWKHGKPAVISALFDLGFTQAQAAKLVEPDCFGGLGFASFELTNNGANIRRMKERLAHIANNQAKPTTEAEGKDGIKLEDDPPGNRVRLFFPGKPSAEIRTELKRSGFRWSPTIGAWQAYRNHSSLLKARQVAGVPA